MSYQLSVISYQRSVVSYLSFPRKLESSSLTSSLSGLTGQSRTKVLDSPIKSGNDRKKLRGNDGKKDRNDYNFPVFNSSEAGFTLVELLITMVVFVLVIAAASQVFTGLLTQFKQQSKIAETNIEGIIGLEILRQDIEHAGYGLPWNVTGANWSDLPNYLEAESISCTPNTNDFDDAPNNAPKAILSRNNASFSGCGANSIFNGSDYLVIKAANVARSATAQKWTFLYSNNTKKTWTPDCENVNKEADCTTKNTVKIIVISPGSTDTNSRSLVVRATDGKFFTQYDDTSNFASTDPTETRFIYGIDPDTPLRMPFNRADYYIWRNSTNPATDEVPDRCAPNTGILRKAVISQSNGQRENPLPLLDCVADMQVVYRRDTNEDGTIDNTTDDISALTAQQIREQVKEVRVYILAHEGQRDMNYTHTPTTIYVGDLSTGSGHNYDIGTNVNYRWKVYTIVVKPNNLR